MGDDMNIPDYCNQGFFPRAGLRGIERWLVRGGKKAGKHVMLLLEKVKVDHTRHSKTPPNDTNHNRYHS